MNRLTLGEPRTFYDGRCENCRQEFETSTRPQFDEDGAYVEQHRTSDCPGCGARLCEHCRENEAAFRCEACGDLHCMECQHAINDLPFCEPCGAAWLDELSKESATCANR